MDTHPSPTPPTPPAGGPKQLPLARPASASKPGYRRGVEVGLRSVHIAAMALVLGGIAMGGTWQTLRLPILATLATGLLLLLTCVRWGCLQLSQGGGAALLLKFALLGAGNLFEGARLEWYLAATVVTSVGSHMSSAWRHFPVLDWLRSQIGQGERAA